MDYEKSVRAEDLPEKTAIAAYELVANLLQEELLALTIEVTMTDEGMTIGRYHISVTQNDEGGKTTAVG
jgi:hypothetical protein